ncbi:MAG: hypothetical protein ACRDZO_07755 [Egibacteraceae bacterium]
MASGLERLCRRADWPKGGVMPRSITGILIVIILILLVVFLVQRV